MAQKHNAPELERSTPAKKTYFLKTYGCQMNVYDSGRMDDVLAGEGYSKAGSAEEADLVLLNTCHIREKAAEKVYSEIGKLNVIKKQRKADGRSMTIGVAGCVAQAEGREMMRRAPAVDMVFGPQSTHQLPRLLNEALQGKRAIDTDFPIEDKFAHLPKTPRGLQSPVSAFLTIQEGCDKFCTFCVVPYTRGGEYSRSVTAIVEEAQRLVDAGAAELTLLGQNVNAYHGQGGDGAEHNLGQLLFALAKIPKLKRLRYTTSHPNDMHDALYEAHRDLDILMPYMHLPVQSGSDRMLKVMNRHHKVALFHDVIAKLRRARPGLALSSDFIVGFPGETDEDFAATMDLVRATEFAASFSFKYSPRPGTPAAAMVQVDEAIKHERLLALQALLNSQHKAFASALIGTKVPVLIEKQSRDEGQLYGRTPYLHPLQTTGTPDMVGKIVDVLITRAGPTTLYGETETSVQQLAEAI